MLEEINAEWLRQLADLKNLFPHSIEATREDNFGIVLLSRHPIENRDAVHIGPAEVPSVLTHMVIRGRSLTVLGTHPLPPGGREYSHLRNQQLEEVSEVLRKESGARVLIGDLNTTPWNHYFKRLVHRSGLRDSSAGFLQTT